MIKKVLISSLISLSLVSVAMAAQTVLDCSKYKTNSMDQFSCYFENEEFGKAAKILKIHAQKGHNDAQYMLAIMYLKGLGIEQSKEKARALLIPLADKGMAQAAFVLGQQSDNEADEMKWFTRAAELGHAVSQTWVGAKYCLVKDPKKNDYAIKMLTRAAKSGYVGAQELLAGLLIDDRYKDYTKAAYWNKEAIKQGSATALFNLGIMNISGYGMPVNEKKAAQLYAQSCEKGFPNACYNLALLYLQGQGVKQDTQKGLELAEKAANAGDAFAMFNLGNMYDQGWYVKPDKQKAKTWYSKACKHNYSPACYRL